MGLTPEGVNVGCGAHCKSIMHCELSVDSGGHMVAEKHVLQASSRQFKALDATWMQCQSPGSSSKK